MTATHPHLVVFDCDGTLVDGQHRVIATMKRTFAEHGLQEPGDRATRRVIGLSLKIAITELLEEDERHHAGALTETFKRCFHELVAEETIDEPFYDGARDLVNALAQRDDVRLAIATGKGRRSVDQMLEREGWINAFHSIQTADNAPSKPNPGMILNALSDTGIGPENAIMIGDTTYDMQMARAADIRAFGVAWGYHDVKSLARAGAHMILDDYPALATALRSHLA